MNELNEIIGHLEGIKGILPQMEGVPLTPNNAKIVLAVNNSVNIIEEKVQAMAKDLADLKEHTADAGDLNTEMAQAIAEEKGADPE